MDEEWRDIPGFPGYQVSDYGRVRSNRMPGGAYGKTKSWKVIKPWTGSRQSPRSLPAQMVSLCRNAKPVKLQVAYLVLLTFVSDRPSGMVICHGDDNRNNNHLSNLRWDTRESNIVDAVANGNVAHGKSHGQVKLAESDIHTVIELHRSGASNETIANRLSVTRATIWAIVNGKTWWRITGIGRGI